MKHLFVLTCLTLLFVAFSPVCAQNTKNKSNVRAASATTKDLPYKASYSSNFQIGNSKYSAMVLKAWKAYDDNTLDDISDMIADTVTGLLPDGTVLKGKDNFLNAFKTYRGGFSKVKDLVTAWVPLKTQDHPEDHGVCIWGDEYDTKADGTTQMVSIHEIWVFNKAGKLSYFRQYAAQAPKGSQ